MTEPEVHIRWILLKCVLSSAFCSASVHAQYEQHLHLNSTGGGVRHLAHDDTSRLVGTTGYLYRQDPFLLYYFGHQLITAHHAAGSGLYGGVRRSAVPLYVTPGPDAEAAQPARFFGDHASSCMSCHVHPSMQPGAGITIASTGPAGRRTPHFFGAGIYEQIGSQIRQEVLSKFDANRNGFIDLEESAGDAAVLIAPTSGGREIDFGSLTPDAHGVPQLNSAFRIWYVDAQGKSLSRAISLHDEAVDGFNFVFQPFGWGRGYRNFGSAQMSQGGEASSIREFIATAADAHMGLQVFDPTIVGDPRSSTDELPYPRVTGLSLAGCMQVDFGVLPDRGSRRFADISYDDPDDDGVHNELTEGDLDAMEFFVLHAPPPARLLNASATSGETTFHTIGCGRCHCDEWTLKAGDAAAGATGDRRLFDLVVTGHDEARLRASLRRQWHWTPGSGYAPRRGASVISGIYSDFKHWDIGPAFFEVRFDGTIQKEHRTAPLWGVGSSRTLGHSGQFLSLREAILAHSGAAAGERRAFQRLGSETQENVIRFLKSLVLYRVEEIPCDIDGDGAISVDFQVAGQWVGVERFDPRFLFSVTPRFRVRGTSGVPGATPLLELTNQRQALLEVSPGMLSTRRLGYPDLLFLRTRNRSR